LSNFQRVFSGSPWEKTVGYCRALKAGNHIFVSGTAPVAEDGKTFTGDAYAQTKRCFEIIESALDKAGASMSDVVRTRMYVVDISRWEEVGRAHGENFGEHPPVTTMVEISKLIDPEMLVEIEVDAIIQ
jgi:enamine deaminase RidA (YjgF/YER057c/UK114 family)